MSLARSASGPGGLTLNIGAANSLSTPSNSAPPAPGGLFASSTAATASPLSGKTATPGGLFDTAPQPANPQNTAGSMFGSSTAQQNTGGGLFGNATTQPASTTGGLFGNATTQPASNTGGLFGSATTQPAPTTGGLFGNPPTQQNQSTGGGLFGNNNSQAKPASGGLFGAATGSATQQQQQQQQSQQTTGGLFGASNNAATTQAKGALAGAGTTTQNSTATGGLFGGGGGGGGLFGNTMTQQKPGTGGLFGASNNTAQPNQPAGQISAVQINYDNLRPRSRFDDLAQPVQDEIALIDKGIQRVIKMKDEIGEFMPQHEKDVEELGRSVKFVESKFRTVQDALNRDIQTVKGLQDVTKKNIGDAQLSFKATDNLKLPSHYHQTGLFVNSATRDSNASNASSAHVSAQDLISYFNRICDDIEKYKKRLDEYRGEIERDMPGVENGLYEQIRNFQDRNASTNGNGAGVAVHDQLSQILSALREMGNAIVVQAGRIADARERLSKLQIGGLYSNGIST